MSPKINYMKIFLFLIFVIMLILLILPSILGTFIREIITSDKEMMLSFEPVNENEFEILIKNVSTMKIESLIVTVGDSVLVFSDINIGDFRKSPLDYSGNCNILFDIKYDDQKCYSETFSLFTTKDHPFKVLKIFVYDDDIKLGR